MHMKNAILGLVLLAAVSFARPPDPPVSIWNNFASACCQYAATYNMVDIGGGYDVDLGEGCELAGWYGLPYPDTGELDCIMWDCEGSIWDEMIYTAGDCDEFGPSSSQCAAAKSRFNTISREGRSAFNAAKLSYMYVARNSALGYILETCGSASPSDIRNTLVDSTTIYRECRADCAEVFSEDCIDWCSGGPA